MDALYARLAIKDDLVQVVIIHAKPVSQLLARRLKLRADDDSAEIKEDSFDGHLLFLVVFFRFRSRCFRRSASFL